MSHDKILTPMTDHDTFKDLLKGVLKVFKLQRCLITNHNVSVASSMDNEGVRVFTTCILESVVYYIDPKSPGSLGFLGGKERIRIPISSTHSSLEAFKRHIIEHAGLKAKPKSVGWDRALI